MVFDSLAGTEKTDRIAIESDFQLPKKWEMNTPLYSKQETAVGTLLTIIGTGTNRCN